MNRAQYLERVSKQFPPARKEFEKQVERAAVDIVVWSRSVSNAIGEISVLEAKNAIIREFTRKLME